MDLEIKRQWVAALRSGDYRQGQKALSVNGKYCCLGVLCDLAEKAGVVSSEVTRTEMISFGDEEVDVTFYGAEGSSSFLPEEVVEWAGTDDGMPSIVKPHPYYDDSTLSSALHILNDDGKSFAEIADMIEQDQTL
jgi:hypothetical protein